MRHSSELIYNAPRDSLCILQASAMRFPKLHNSRYIITHLAVSKSTIRPCVQAKGCGPATQAKQLTIVPFAL
jgi:hypothetical protein